jgi:tryptophan 2,3-dioxygenase
MINKSQHEESSFYNKRGVIAEQYSQLQAVDILNKAKEAYALPKASQASTIRALFQAAEVALLNLNDLMMRSTNEVATKRFGSLAVKLSWARSFHTVMVRLSSIPQKLGLVSEDEDDGSELHILDSPAFKMYYDSFKMFDEEVVASIERGDLLLADLLNNQSLDNNQMHFMHLIRLCNHETTIWERNLESVFVSARIPNYEEFVVSRSIYNAVYDTMLEGDTYYTQFRGLHQIPEILTAEINDHIEMAIVHMREKSLRRAYEHIRCLNILSEGVLASLLPIADNLATVDYYNIRENLGLTSGSHSVNIHYHLFRDLYEQLWSAFTALLADEYPPVDTHKDITELLHAIDRERFNNEQAFLFHLLMNELLKLRAFINEWRELHLHFPRNNIGGDHTKSLTGSSDAVQAVKKMRDAALIRDPFQPLTHSRKLDTPPENSVRPSLRSYLETEDSLDHKIVETTGSVTKQRFKDVQKRTGVFASKSPFIPPPRRQV